MENIQILTVFLFAVLILLLFVMKGEIICPSILFISSFFVVSFLYSIMRESLEMKDIYPETLAFLIFGVLAFLFVQVSFFAFRKKPKKSLYYQTGVFSKEKLNTNFFCFFSVLSIAAIFLLLFVMMSNSSYSLLQFSSLTRDYKNKNLGNELTNYHWLYEIISQLYKLCLSFLYVSTYLIIRNWKSQNKKCKALFLISSLLELIFTTLFYGGRQDLIEYVFFILFIGFITLYRRKKYKLIKKYLCVLLLLALISIPLFYYSSILVGRDFTYIAIQSPIEYLATYLCGGLYYLDSFIMKPANTMFFGQSSFAFIYDFFYKLGLATKEMASYTYHKFYTYGTTVTFFGRWYEDFGLLGMIIMTTFVSLFYGWLYYKKASTKSLCLLLYLKMSMSLLWAGYDDRIFSMLSFNYLVQMILIIVLFKMFAPNKRRNYLMEFHTYEKKKYIKA